MYEEDKKSTEQGGYSEQDAYTGRGVWTASAGQHYGKHQHESGSYDKYGQCGQGIQPDKVRIVIFLILSEHHGGKETEDEDPCTEEHQQCDHDFIYDIDQSHISIPL